MKYVKLYESFVDDLNEYRSENANLYTVRASEKPVIGKPVFTDDSKDYDKTQAKIDADLKSYQKHMDEAKEKMKEWREKTKLKGDHDWYDRAEKARELAFKVVNDAAKFMKEFNEKYKELKDDLIGEDHVKVAKAIYELQDIYPYKLIEEAGKLKRMKHMKYDAQFMKDCLKWTNAIMNRYEVLKAGGKVLGKTDAQIEGMRKQSRNMRMRWGMF